MERGLFDWNVNLLKHSGQFLDWISIHGYWDAIHQTNAYADYDACMVYTNSIGDSVRKVRGLLEAMDLGHIRIAFDEWNLRGWYHPNVHTVKQGVTKEEYLYPRDKNDDNTKYTMADAVFTACFLNMCNRNCDVIGMANYAPVVNTRGCIFTHKDGIVLRSTYHVFDLYVNYLGDQVLETWSEEQPARELRSVSGALEKVEMLDVAATSFSGRGGYALAAVNKDPERTQTLTLCMEASGEVCVRYICGESTESYNDIDCSGVEIQYETLGAYHPGMQIALRPHSVNIIWIGVTEKE